MVTSMSVNKNNEITEAFDENGDLLPLDHPDVLAMDKPIAS